MRRITSAASAVTAKTDANSRTRQPRESFANAQSLGVLKRASLTLFAICLVLVFASVSRAETYQIISTQSSVVGSNLNKTVSTVQVGTNPLNRFFMSRVHKNVPKEARKGVILLLPPGGSGFQNYEVGENDDYRKSFVAFFAIRNYDVYGLSQRSQGIPAGSCESGALDCSVMEGWGLRSLLDDVDYIRQQIALEYPYGKPVVGGLSLGSILALGAIDEHPNDYAGAILIDGSIYRNDPAVQAIHANFTAGLDFLLANGVFYDGQGAPGFKMLSNLAKVDPNGLTPLPGFPPGFTNHQAFVAAMTAPPLSPLAPFPGYYNLAGSVAEDRFFFANEALVHSNIAVFLDYTPLRWLRDLTAGLAGDRTYNNNLDNFTGPVIMFAAGHGFGPAMQDTAQLMTSATITLNVSEELGHVDYPFAMNHRQIFERPILNWLKTVNFQ